MATATRPAAAPAATWEAAACPAATEMARKEFEETGRIFGTMFLTPTGKNIWISQYDVKELTK